MTVLAIVVSLVGCGDDPAPAAGTTTIEAGGTAFNAVVREPSGDGSSLTVLFLHGGSYTSRIWADRGVLDRVSEAGHRAVAVDLPGSGDTESTDEPAAEVLTTLVEDVAPKGSVVLVSPSASGRWSLALLGERPDVDLAGFVAVAPVGIAEFAPGAEIGDVPALLVWGEDDDVIFVDEAAALQQHFTDSELVVIPDGSHAPYDDEPEAFTDTLLTFLQELDHPENPEVTDRDTPPVRGVLPSAASPPGTPLGDGIEVAEGTVLIADPIPEETFGEDGEVLRESWTATSLVDGGQPLTIVDDYLRQAAATGLTDQLRHGCMLDGEVTICSGSARTPDQNDPRSLGVSVVQGVRGDVLSDHVVLRHGTGELWWNSHFAMEPGDAEPPASPAAEEWPPLASTGEALGTANEIDRPLVIEEDSRLVAPPHLSLEDATGGIMALLEVTGDPRSVLQAYLDQLAAHGFDTYNPEANDIDGAVVTTSSAGIPGGDYYGFTLVERDGRPTWLHIAGGHD